MVLDFFYLGFFSTCCSTAYFECKNDQTPYNMILRVLYSGPLLLRTKSTLLLQHLFLLLLDLRVNLSTFGRLVAVILCLNDTDISRPSLKTKR